MSEQKEPQIAPNCPEIEPKPAIKPRKRRLKSIDYRHEQDKLKTIVYRQINILLERSYDEYFTGEEIMMLEKFNKLLINFKQLDEEYLASLSKEELEQLLKDKTTSQPEEDQDETD